MGKTSINKFTLLVFIISAKSSLSTKVNCTRFRSSYQHLRVYCLFMFSPESKVENHLTYLTIIRAKHMSVKRQLLEDIKIYLENVPYKLFTIEFYTNTTSKLFS